MDPLFNVLFKKVEDFKPSVKDLDHLEIMNNARNAAMEKLNKYYSQLHGKSYYVSLILDPRYVWYLKYWVKYLNTNIWAH